MPALKDKVAIVTGGARGIGAACAAALCARGAAVIIGDILDDAGGQTAQALAEKGYRAAFRHHDASDEKSWQQLIAFAEETFGAIDCLVNNAGINFAVTLEKADASQFRQVLDVNLIGPFLGMQAVLPAMKARGGGSIINISSNSTRKMVAETAIYGTSKAALAYLSKAAAINFGEQGYNIRVNSVHPGATRTDMTMGGDNPAVVLPIIDKLVAAIPMGRMGEPPDIADVVAFLASDDSRYMSGAELFVDGAASLV
ncbi:MAG: glucose 1-dehydrogenase [Porticoccaceae bacterium]